MAKNIERNYELLVRVGANSLTTVIDVLKNAAEIVSLRQIEAVDVAEKAQAAKPAVQRVPGKTGPQLLLDHMTMRPHIVEWSMEQLGDVLQSHGFSSKSAHPAVSELVSDGKVERHKRSHCRLIGPAKAV